MSLIQIAFQLEGSIRNLKAELNSIRLVRQQAHYYSEAEIDFQKLDEMEMLLGSAITSLSAQVERIKASEEYQKVYGETYG